MLAQSRTALRMAAARLTHNIYIESAVALVALAVGLAGVLTARQLRPYVGEPLTDLALVPAQVAVSPNVPVLGLFALSIGLAAIGAAWFIVRVVHWRFWSPVRRGRVWRQALLIGILAAALVWLRLNQALTLPLAGVLIVALSLIELYFNIRNTPRTDKPA